MFTVFSLVTRTRIWPLKFKMSSSHTTSQKNAVNTSALKSMSSENSPCCPAGAWGNLKNTDYKARGIVEEISATKLKVYRVGQSEKCIVWNYDIFGFEGGRSRQMADFFADNGYMVVMPDFYRGTFKDPSVGEQSETVAFLKEHTKWDEVLKADWEQSVLPYIRGHGAKSIGTIGTCWGSYMVLRLSACVDVKAGVSMHPSHSPISNIIGEGEEHLLKEVKCPQLFLPAGGDHENSKFGGLGKKVLGDALEIVEFPDMLHGWTTRGDISDKKVERDVLKALNMSLSFYRKYL